MPPPYQQQPPYQPTPAQTPPSRFFGLLLLGLGALSGGSLLLSRGIRALHWADWPHTQARLAAARTTSSARSGGAFNCERTYELTVNGAPASLTSDAPCLVLIGSDPEPGEVVEVAHESPTSTKVLSATEVFALGVFELAAVAVGAVGAGLLLASRRGARTASQEF